VHVAPQSVDNDFWGAPGVASRRDAGWADEQGTRFLFVGRPVPEKGLDVLLAAWRSLSATASAALVLAGARAHAQPSSQARGAPVFALGALAPERLREVYAGCEVLVVPSRPTRTFREPWGLVVNEAMNRGLAVIATDSVGAAAGGLVRDGHNGLVVPAADAGALSRAIERLCAEPALRSRMGEAGRHDVRGYSHEAWAEGFSRALASVGVSRGRW
jgi:glycosyltransferase involved in cell wall biosynthesis